MENKKIDAHCHVFNKDVLTFQVLTELIKALLKMIFHHGQREAKTTESLIDKIKGLINEIKRVINFLSIGLEKDSIAIFQTLQETEKNYRTVPLMFDLEFCFVSTAEATMRKIEDKIKIMDNALFRPFETHRESFDQFILGFIQEISTHLKTKNKQVDLPSSDNTKTNSLRELVNELIEVKHKLDDLIDKIKGQGKQINKYHQVFQQDTSFDKQLQEIIALRKAYPDLVFPFFGVDPRRKGVLEMVKHYVKEGGSFFGVKIYAPNGYSPTDPVLYGTDSQPDCVYKYCIDNDIPIIAHCSCGGFATFAMKVDINGTIYENGKLKEVNKAVKFEKTIFNGGVEERANKLNHPMIWEKVLQKYKNLRLDLAHFGIGNKEWTDKIYELMSTYKNLFTDLSCYTDEGSLINVRDNYFRKATPAVKSKFMYGSDFYLDMLFTDSFNEYVSVFNKVFSPEEMGQLSIANNLNFMKKLVEVEQAV